MKASEARKISEEAHIKLTAELERKYEDICTNISSTAAKGKTEVYVGYIN